MTQNPKISEKVYVTTNNLGLRGEDIPPDAENYLTVITIGGSTTHCYYNSDDKTWPSRLEDKTDDYFYRVWLNNAGLSGHSTYGHIVLLKDHISFIKPKMALFLIGLNDVGREKEDTFDLFDEESQDAVANIKRILYKSELFSLLLNIARKIAANKINLRHDITMDIKQLSSFDITEDEIEVMVENHRRQYLPGYKHRIERIIDMCKENDIEPIFITQPVLYGRGNDELTNVDLERIKVREGLNGLAAWKVLEAYNNATIETESKNGCFFIDLAENMPKNSEYYYELIHFTDYGNEKVASIIFEGIKPYMEKKYYEFSKSRD